MVDLYCITPNRTWVVVHHTGMHLATVKGKKAKRKMQKILEEMDFQGLTWKECAIKIAAAK